MVSQTKKSQVDTLVSSLTNNPHFFVVGFEKTKHKSLEDLRKELKKSQAKILIVKNTLFEKALSKLAVNNKQLQALIKKIPKIKNQSAIITLSTDWLSGLKSFYNFSKKEASLSFKIGILDQQYYDQTTLNTIAQLPSREELLGKIIGSMKNPMSKFIYALKYNTNKLVYILKQKSAN